MKFLFITQHVRFLDRGTVSSYKGNFWFIYMDYLLKIVYLCTIFYSCILLLWTTVVQSSSFSLLSTLYSQRHLTFSNFLWELKTAYFAFNIQCPKAFTNVLVFIQHLLWGIKDKGQKISPLLNQVYMII